MYKYKIILSSYVHKSFSQWSICWCKLCNVVLKKCHFEDLKLILFHCWALFDHKTRAWFTGSDYSSKQKLHSLRGTLDINYFTEKPNKADLTTLNTVYIQKNIINCMLRIAYRSTVLQDNSYESSYYSTVTVICNTKYKHI